MSVVLRQHPWEAAGASPQSTGADDSRGSSQQPERCGCPIAAQGKPGSVPGLPTALSPPQVTVALSTEELVRQKKALACAALAGRSFSTPHGELDAHRLCQALEKVSQKRNQSLEGRLDQLGPQPLQTQPSAAESSVCRLWGRGRCGGAGCPRLAEPSLCRCPDNLLSPTHLDWDMLVEPSYLFSASPAPEAGQPGLGDAGTALRCQVVIHALRAGGPVSWEVTASLESLLQPREAPGREVPPRRAAKAWDKPLHRLAARSVVRDSESVAQREAKLEQGGCRCLSPLRLRHPPPTPL